MRCKAKKEKKSRHFTMVLLDEKQWVQIFSNFRKVFISEKYSKPEKKLYYIYFIIKEQFFGVLVGFPSIF